MKTLIVLIFVFSCVSLLSQQNEYLPCGFEGMKSFKEDYPVFTDFAHDSLLPDSFIIPVVVHVVHNYGSENISDEQIRSALKMLNDDFNARNEEVSVIIPEFIDIVGNPRITFRLARIDPNGNPTNGITRTATELTYTANDLVKYLVWWDNSKYYNIWVANELVYDNAKVAGYAYYPCYWPGEYFDGIMVKHTLFGSIGSAWANSQKMTLTHETGHYLGLWHPWCRGTITYGIEENCDCDDDVDDTPNETGSTNDELYHYSCESLDNRQNIMGYAIGHMSMFTVGQVEKMYEVLMQKSCGSRFDIWQDSNLDATGVLNDYNDRIVARPVGDFIIEKVRCCEGSINKFTAFISNSDYPDSCTYEWYFEGGEPEVAYGEDVQVRYDSAGKYDVKLTVSNRTGIDYVTKEKVISVFKDDEVYFAPFVFINEDEAFPDIWSDSISNWIVSDNGINTFETFIDRDRNGSVCLGIDNRYNEPETKNSIISPKIGLSGIDGQIEVSIEYAYAKSSIGSDDELTVYISNDCGHSWDFIRSWSADNIVSSKEIIVEEEFLPKYDEWKTIRFGLNGYSGEIVQMKIEVESSNGNYLYINDISVDYPLGRNEYDNDEGFVIINPVKEYPEIIIQHCIDEDIEYMVYDLSGKVLCTGSFRGDESNVMIKNCVDSFQRGVFIIELRTKDRFWTKKVVKI